MEHPPTDRDTERGTLIPAARPAPCPVCNAPIPWQYWGDPMYCPACHAGLRTRERYARVLWLAALVIAAGIVYASGLRGGSLFWGAAVVAIPVALVVRFITIRLFPVEFEATSDVRGVLFGPPPVEPDADGDEGAPGSWPPEADDGPVTEDDHTRKGVPRFRLLRPARTIDGFFLRIAALLLVGFSLWGGARSVMYEVFPNRVAILGGPAGFAIRAKVGPDGVVFVNESNDRWSCAITIGAEHNGTSASTSFRLEPGQSHGVEYRAFVPTTASRDLRERQRAARERMMAHCTDGAGRGHLEHLR
jgi:hypothetical protein